MRPTAVFMGTPEIAVPALRLLATRADVRLVITQPDRPAGRGMKLTPPPVKVAAGDLGLPVWQPESMRGTEADPRLAGHDLFVVMAYGEILRQPVLDLPKACINLHGSLLPRWRGASPLQACLRAGDAETGVCVMEMVPALDAGPVYLCERLPLTSLTTLPDLHDALAQTAAVALGRFLDAWPDIRATPQDDAAATFCRKLTSAEGRLDWSLSAADIERWVRAYTPAPGCWTMFGADRVRILEVRSDAAALPPGAIAVSGGRLLVGCRDGSLEIVRLQVAGRGVTTAAEYLRGHLPPQMAG
jgi:methionyl-tRNA formyltransferase